MNGPAAAPRAILFDIDGTLVRSRGYAAVFDAAMEEVFGIRGDLGSIRPDGMTDPDILALLLDGRTPLSGGVTPRRIADFEMTLARRLEHAVRAGSVSIWSLPGVLELLAALASRADACLGIVTGNMRATARVKLGAVGIEGYFRGGGYGSDAPSRAVLPRVALRRMAQAERIELAPRRAVIVGDTPHDLAAARAHGMRCVLVATGRYSAAELAAVQPDVLLYDLGDGERALRAILADE
jgi:phosphoglycolate phosphatase-like HAD superfamily hydrolase